MGGAGRGRGQEQAQTAHLPPVAVALSVSDSLKSRDVENVSDYTGESWFPWDKLQSAD